MTVMSVVATDIYAGWFKEKRAIMGTEINVEVWHEKQHQADICIANVFEEMVRIDKLMSPFRKDSELSRVNNQASKQAVIVSAELFDLVKKSLEFSEISEGAFDITFSSIGYLYDYAFYDFDDDAVGDMGNIEINGNMITSSDDGIYNSEDTNYLGYG